MKMEITVAEAMDIINGIREERQNLLAMIRENVQETVGHYLSLLMDKELSHFPGRDRHIHCHEDVNHRNGSYHRKFTLKGIGEIDLKVPRDRNGLFSTQIIPRSKQYEDVLRENLSVMCLAGVSTRTLSMMSERLIGRRLSAGEISNVSKELTVEKVPVLVVVGVTTEGYRTVVGLQTGDKESATNWREMFKDLKRRGLDGGTIALGVMDGLPALERVFKEEFPYAKTQRCQVHVARNVLAKVPQKLKKQIGDEVRSMFYASSKAKALEFFEQFKATWKQEIPSAVKCLENSLESCLTYLQFPEEEWLCLRTTNVIERVNKEFKRRTKPMEILAGERSCYMLLAFVCLKMEVHWRTKPIGKVPENLPSLKKLAGINIHTK